MKQQSEFRDRVDTVADGVHLIKLAGVAVGMGFEQNFVRIFDLLLERKATVTRRSSDSPITPS